MRSRFTEQTLGIGSQANAAGYTALTGPTSCERSKNANSGTWTAAASAKYVRKTFIFILITWTAALSARNVDETSKPFLMTWTAASCAKNVLKINQYTFETSKATFGMKHVFNHDEKNTFKNYIIISVELNCNLNILGTERDEALEGDYMDPNHMLDSESEDDV